MSEAAKIQGINVLQTLKNTSIYLEMWQETIMSM